MPVESRDDLLKRLRDDILQLTKMMGQASFAADTDVRVKDPSLLLADLENAATRIESDAKRIAELEAEVKDLDRKYSLTMASRLEWRRQAEAAERVLAECERLLSRYFKETPLGHQPHMIAHEADAAIKVATAIRSGKPEE